MSNERQQRAARAEQMRKEREKADRKQRNLITIGIVVVVVALIAVGGYGVKAAMDGNESEQRVIQPKNATDDFGIVYTTKDAGGIVEPETEPVSVELYEDFQCPACLSFEQQSGEFLQQQVTSGAITITYRPYSFLDGRGSPNEYSHRSTNIALCTLEAGGVSDYVTVHNYLYANQPDEGTNGPENNEILDALKDLDVATPAESCIKTDRFFPWIDKARDTAFESDRQVQSTPTVYVDDKLVENPNPQTLQAAIDAAAKA